MNVSNAARIIAPAALAVLSQLAVRAADMQRACKPIPLMAWREIRR